MPALVRAFAPAKLNLYLHVLGRRADGYHLLDSLVAFADCGDMLTVRPADGYGLEITGPFAAPLRAEDPERNLVTRAVRGLATALGRPADVAVTLDKRLPVASGIGGGSSDAAAALRAAAALWDLAPDDPRVGALAPALGADVPVCLHARTAFFSGAGEVVEPAPALPPDAWLVLVNPGIALGTREVFQARTAPFTTTPRPTRPAQDAADLAALLKTCANDLEPPARRLAPTVPAVLDALAAAPGCLLARMSGSGATCFGLFAGEAPAQAAAATLRAAEPGWWVQAAGLLAGPPVVERVGG